MFSLPQSTIKPQASLEKRADSSEQIEQQELDGLPLLRVTEPSSILENLFRLCYLMQDPALPDLDTITATLEAAIKYDMREASQILRARLVALVHTDPPAERHEATPSQTLWSRMSCRCWNPAAAA